jgi:dTDP-glucose pyrophosphorylase
VGFVVDGDTYLADPAPLRELTSSRLISILVKEVENPRQYGVAVIRDGVIVRVAEKPKEPPSNIAILPFYKFPCGFFKYLERIKPGVGASYSLQTPFSWQLRRAWRRSLYIIPTYTSTSALPKPI